MRWSWKIGQLAGIDVRIHATFLLVLVWVLVSSGMAGKNPEAMLAGVTFAIALLACVAVHEIGHLIAARKFGLYTRDITLLPIGGVARLERVPADPWQEIRVALAGPAISLGVTAFLCGWLSLTHHGAPFVKRLLVANTGFLLFNLLPAFPMDGGRVLRALLAPRMTYARATQLVVSAGQALAFTLGFVGLFTNPMLLFTGLCVWIGAGQEAYAAQMKSALSGTPASAAMLTKFETLWCSDTLADAVRMTLRGSQHDFPVLDQERVVGILTRTDLLVALTDFGHDHPVASVMIREFLITEPAEMLEITFQRLQACACHTMPVVHGGRAVGLITMDNLGEYLLTEAALKRRVVG